MDAIYDNHNFLCVCEILPNHLYFVTVQNINNGGSCDAIIPHTDDLHFFNTDTELNYHNFYGDFGPLSITCLYKFCKKLTNKLATYAGDAFYEKFANSRFGKKDVAEKLRERFVKKKIIVYYTSTNNEKRANAAFLISAFAVLYLGFSPRLAHRVLQPTKMKYRPFQDASVGLSPYKITMRDCLDAIHKASVFGFFNFNDFNVSECSFYENIEHGDLNWIIPLKFLAFPGPVEEKSDYYHHPNFYVEYFLTNNVSDVVRLNQRAYDSKCFTMFNLKHHDLYMQDGGDPPETILKNFMSIAENAEGAIAVHCKAGLGRTGTLIGAYLLKHYRMTAREAIAWIRICRPGSVIGHQQTWLENHEEILWCEGNEWRYKMYGKTEIVPFLPYGIYSFESPKKEFPGLKDLLTNLTKRARYRFVLKNQPRKSRTKLQQTIRSILEAGKPTKAKEDEKKPEKPIVFEKASHHEPEVKSEIYRPQSAEVSENVRYLKAPPRTDYGTYESESSQQEYQFKNHEAHRGTRYSCEYPSPQRKSEYYNPHCYVQQGMHAYPDPLRSDRGEHESGRFASPERRSYAPMGVPKISKPECMPKSRSVDVPAKFQRARNECDLVSKSIDRNWKQNEPSRIRYFSETAAKRISDQEAVTNKFSYGRDDDLCSFDSRINTISQYSRFNKTYFGREYSEQPQMNTPREARYFEDQCKSGLSLSPEDLQSWMETFDQKKTFETQGDKLNAIKRSKIT